MFLVFFLVALTIVGSVHYYLYRRLAVAPRLPPPWSAVMAIAFIVLVLAVPFSLFAARVLGPQAARYLSFPVFVWLGTMMLLFFAFASIDLVRGAAYVFARVLASQDLVLSPERRLLVARVVALVGVATVLPAAALSVARGLGDVVVKHVEVELERLPPQFDGFGIAQLTDLHLGPMRDGAWLTQVVARTNGLEPDLVAITGDLVDGSVEHLAGQVEPLRALRADEGVFMVTGNHEYFDDPVGWMEYLPELGIRILRNERVVIRREDARFDLAGVDDPVGGRFAPGHGTDVERALGGRDRDRVAVLLAHQPNVIEDARSHGADLVLSGHTHGGQLWPFSLLVHMAQPYVSGLFRRGGTQIYVSEGTGFWGPPMRLGTTPEITLVTLRSARPK
jgi:predicted MPP superfamily phosphohydrolase